MKHYLKPGAVLVLGSRFAVVSGNGFSSIDCDGSIPPAHYIVYGGLNEGRSGQVVMTKIII